MRSHPGARTYSRGNRPPRVRNIGADAAKRSPFHSCRFVFIRGSTEWSRLIVGGPSACLAVILTEGFRFSCRRLIRCFAITARGTYAPVLSTTKKTSHEHRQHQTRLQPQCRRGQKHRRQLFVQIRRGQFPGGVLGNDFSNQNGSVAGRSASRAETCPTPSPKPAGQGRAAVRS